LTSPRTINSADAVHTKWDATLPTPDYSDTGDHLTVYETLGIFSGNIGDRGWAEYKGDANRWEVVSMSLGVAVYSVPVQFGGTLTNGTPSQILAQFSNPFFPDVSTAFLPSADSKKLTFLQAGAYWIGLCGQLAFDSIPTNANANAHNGNEEVPVFLNVWHYDVAGNPVSGQPDLQLRQSCPFLSFKANANFTGWQVNGVQCKEQVAGFLVTNVKELDYIEIEIALMGGIAASLGDRYVAFAPAQFTTYRLAGEGKGASGAVR
jgi:hypothetical protein